MTSPVKLAYSVYEPAGGADNSLAPIIYIHGISGSKENWLHIPQIIANETKRKSYAYDARNHGDSGQTDTYSFAMNTEDLLLFMDTIKAPKAILVGHSMGGITAIKASLKKPERVEMIFVEDMFVKKVPKEILKAVADFINVWVDCVKTIPKDFDEEKAIKHCVDLLLSLTPPEEQNLMCDKEKLYKSGIVFNRNSDGQYEVKFNKDALIGALMNAGKGLDDPTGQYDGPSYFIYGSTSPFEVDKEEEHIKKHFPKAELIEIEGANHDVHLGFPEKFIEAILQCFKK